MNQDDTTDDSASVVRTVLTAIAWALIISIGALALAGSVEFEKAVIGMLVLMPVVLKGN